MILAIDTSAARGQLLIHSSTQPLHYEFWEKEGSHSEHLTSRLEASLLARGLQLNDVQSVLVVVGPGSFTGLRVGINCAKSLAYSLGCEIVPINSLWALAKSCGSSKGKVTSLLDAQRNSVFLGQYEYHGNELRTLAENQIIELNHLDKFIQGSQLVCGSGWTRYYNLLSTNSKSNLKFANEWIDLNALVFWYTTQSGNVAKQWQHVQPIYLRKSAAEENKR